MIDMIKAKKEIDKNGFVKISSFLTKKKCKETIKKLEFIQNMRIKQSEFIGNIEKQDCVDESASTTSYLKYFQDNELIFMHSVVVPQSRGALIDGRWPHFSATIRDKKNKKQFVIDSWFRDNGEPPVVMELQDWVYDWRRANEVQNEELN